MYHVEVVWAAKRNLVFRWMFGKNHQTMSPPYKSPSFRDMQNAFRVSTCKLTLTASPGTGFIKSKGAIYISLHEA